MNKITTWQIPFARSNNPDPVWVPTKRPEWLYGAAYVGAAPDNPLAGHTLTNPADQTELPVIADPALQGDELALGVPAHDSHARGIAEQAGLAITPVVAQDFGEPLDDAKDISGAVVIGYDPRTSLFMGLKHGGLGWMVGGGREDGETYLQCAQRELHEEAGFAAAEAWLQLGDPVYSYYYNDIKRSNRRSLGYNFLAILDASQATAQRQEAHEDFTVWWTPFDELYASIQQTGGGVDHWLEALRRAKQAASDYVAGKPYSPGPYTGEGIMINAGPHDGLATEDARQAIATQVGALAETVGAKTADES